MAVNLTNTELKKVAQNALKNSYGFAPALNAIALLETCGDGSYILFHVGKHIYEVDKYSFVEKKEEFYQC